jgi:hypothetical protein
LRPQAHSCKRTAPAPAGPEKHKWPRTTAAIPARQDEYEADANGDTEVDADEYVDKDAEADADEDAEMHDVEVEEDIVAEYERVCDEAQRKKRVCAL